MRGLFWLLSVLALGGLLLAGTPAQAECTQCVTAYFEGGAGSVDTYKGKAGDGWAGPWVETTWHGTGYDTLTNANPVDSGYYVNFALKCTISNNGSGAISRDYGYDADENPCGIDLTEEHCVDFKIRFDYELDTFTASNDMISVFDAWSSGATPPSAAPYQTWGIGAIGGYLNTDWIVYARDNGAAYWHDTGLPLVEGQVVDCSLAIDPANNTWEVKIDAGNDESVDWDSEIPYDATTNPYGLTSTQKLAFRQEDESVGGFIHFHCRSTPNGDEHAISFDSVEICQPCIPEPSTMVLLFPALAGLVLVRRK